MSQGVAAFHIEFGSFRESCHMIPTVFQEVPWRTELSSFQFTLHLNTLLFRHFCKYPVYLLLHDFYRAVLLTLICTFCLFLTAFLARDNVQSFCEHRVTFWAFRIVHDTLYTIHALLWPSSCFRNSVQNGWDVCVCGRTDMARIVYVTSRYVSYCPSGL